WMRGMAYEKKYLLSCSEIRRLLKRAGTGLGGILTPADHKIGLGVSARIGADRRAPVHPDRKHQIPSKGIGYDLAGNQARGEAAANVGCVAMILGVNGIRLVGDRSGVARCIEGVFGWLGELEHP